MSLYDEKVHETDVDGCHVTVKKLGWKHHGENQYFSTVSYKLHNANGVHIASPEWQNIGSKKETILFVFREVDRASDDNKPPLENGLTKHILGDGVSALLVLSCLQDNPAVDM